jgi:Na+/H+ antiporter NhaA
MATGQRPIRHSWLASDRPVPRLIARPVQRFLETEASGGIILLIATSCALLWANSALSESYGSLWTTDISPSSIKTLLLSIAIVDDIGAPTLN